MGGDPIRRSGEFRIEQNLGELLTQIHQSVEKRLDNVVDRFEKHADEVEKRLAQGDTTMALMNQSIKGVENQLTTIRSDMKIQSDKIHDVEARRPIDRTPRATPALEPKAETPWITKALKKGAEAGIMSVCAAIALGIFLWLVRGNAAKIIDTSPAAAPAISSPASPSASTDPR